MDGVPLVAAAGGGAGEVVAGAGRQSAAWVGWKVLAESLAARI